MILYRAIFVSFRIGLPSGGAFIFSGGENTMPSAKILEAKQAQVSELAEKVKTAEKDTDRSNTALFSREKIMSDDFKPTSGKNSDSLSLPEH